MLEYNRSDMRNAIEERVANPHYRKLLTLKLCEGYTYEAAAEAANYSTQHAKRLCKKYKPFLEELMETLKLLQPRLYEAFLNKIRG